MLVSSHCFIGGERDITWEGKAWYGSGASCGEGTGGDLTGGKSILLSSVSLVQSFE